jgi:hypothetical protein
MDLGGKIEVKHPTGEEAEILFPQHVVYKCPSATTEDLL